MTSPLPPSRSANFDDTVRSELPSNRFSRYAEAEFLAEIGTWICDVQTGAEQWSPGLAAVLDIPRDIPNPKLFEFLPLLEPEVTRFLRSRLPFYRKRFLHRTITGATELLFQAEKRYDTKKNVTEIIATLQNVSDIVWSMGTSEIGEQLLETIATGEDLVALAVDTQLVMIYFEGEGWDKLRVDTHAQLGKRLDSVVEDHPQIVAAFRESVQGRAQNTNLTFRGRHYLVKIRPYHDVEGAIAGAMCLAVDITERSARLESLERDQLLLEETIRQQTAQLRAGHATMRAVLETARTGVILADRSDRIVFVNPALSRMLGYDENEMIGHSLAGWFPSETIAEMRCILTEPEAAAFRAQLPFSHKDGREIRVDVNAALHADGPDPSKVLIVTLLDVTG